MIRMDALKSYRDLVAKVDAQWTRSVELLAGRLRCAAGCSDCCRHITVFPVEAVSLTRAMQDLPAEKIEALRRRAHSAAADGPCPLLDAEGCCALYAARPVICRTQGLPLLIRTDRGDQVANCPKNDLSGAPLPAGSIVALERLNEILAAVNRLFVETAMPDAPERISIAAALEMTPR
jgi:hypothetical protein